MISINANVEVRASLDKVWDIVSDVDRDAEYWSGLSSAKTIRRDGNVIEREVTVGFMGHKGHQIVKLYPKTSVDIEMTDGPLVGSRKITLSPLGNTKTKIEASWHFTFSKVPIFARAFVKSQIENVTKESLEKISLEAEGSMSGSTKNKNKTQVVLSSSK